MMVQIFLYFLMVGVALGMIDHCLKSRYGQKASFQTSQMTLDIVSYRNVTDAFDQSTHNLRMAITRPSATADPLGTKRPVILVAHGGAWLPQFGSADEMYPHALALSLAGYVTANLEYRTGWGGCNEQNLLKACSVCSDQTANFPRAVYAAVQDVREAVHWLVARADQYGIDPDAVFLGGNSAGSFNIQLAALWNQTEADAFAPAAQTDSVLPSLGPLPELSHPIRAIYDSCGGVFTDPRQWTGDRRLPVISFHDEGDCVSPWQIGQLLNCAPLSPCQKLAQSFGSKKVWGAFGADNPNLPLSLNSIPLSIGHCTWPDDNAVKRASCFFKRVLCAQFQYTAATLSEWFPTQSVPRTNINKQFIDSCFSLGRLYNYSVSTTTTTSVAAPDQNSVSRADNVVVTTTTTTTTTNEDNNINGVTSFKLTIGSYLLFPFFFFLLSC